MNISLDKFAGTLIFSGLTLLFLPDKWLLSWQVALYVFLPLLFMALLCYGLRLTKPLTLLTYLLLLLAQLVYVHFPALSLLKQADNIANLPKILHAEFTVQEVLNQQDFQTVVIVAKLAEDLPEQRIYAQWKAPQIVKIGERYEGD